MIVHEDIGKALGTDYLHIRDELTESELDYLERTRRFVDDEVLPAITDCWERAELPLDLVRRLGELRLVGDGIEGYGCPEMSPLAAGLIAMELNRGDGSLGTFLGVQGGLAMRSIAMLGSEEHKRTWLPGMARVDKLGAFALTEPEHGSDSIALETSARRDGSDWIIDGRKRWIGNGTVADVIVVWARDPPRLPRHATHGRHRSHPHVRGHRDDSGPDRGPRPHRHERVRLKQSDPIADLGPG